MRRCLLIITIFILNIFLLDASENGDSDTMHSIAGELSVMGQTQSFDDPYSLPVGAGLLYEFHGLSIIPLYFGADIQWFGFIPLDKQYDNSYMIIPSISIGYSFINSLSGKSSLAISPFLSGGIYFREYTKNSIRYKGSKPVIKSGIDIILRTENKLFFSIGLFYSFFLDNNMISFPGYRNRIGYAF